MPQNEAMLPQAGPQPVFQKASNDSRFGFSAGGGGNVSNHANKLIPTQGRGIDNSKNDEDGGNDDHNGDNDDDDNSSDDDNNNSGNSGDDNNGSNNSDDNNYIGGNNNNDNIFYQNGGDNEGGDGMGNDYQNSCIIAWFTLIIVIDENSPSEDEAASVAALHAPQGNFSSLANYFMSDIVYRWT